MNEWPIHWAHPERAFVLGVWLLVFVGLVWLERRGDDALDRLVGPALRARLVVQPSRWRRRARLALVGLAGLAMGAALLQPQWGLRYVAAPRVGAEIMIALDVSRSMLADDARPSRLERAKAEVSDLLSYLGDDQVGLIAFAGRATVLSPMTPDKSFLRLALDGAGPHSVSRGGTRLAEPILRAVAGLGRPGPAQRALILITDGEDHESFALDAARKAAEAGIKIIAIGFGDERGSRIHVTDPRTGARTLLRDANGDPVVSRLDGDLLREIALETGGAYVPAGTGVLDLASIYDAHIARLTRGQLEERGRTIRDEAYPAFVALALLCLLGAVVITAGRRGGLAALVLLGALHVGAAPPASAQVAPSPAMAEDASPAAAQAVPGVADPGAGAGEPAEPAPPAARDVDPRALFNRGNARLAEGDFDAASTLYRDARREAKDDLELRQAATYNLGLAAAARADASEASDPSQALAALHEAADWFREAAAAAPEAKAPRHNLDVTLRRALALADELDAAGRADVAQQLDALVEAQRARAAGAATLLEEVVHGGELEAAEAARPRFRDAATEQRVLLAETSELADRVARERDGLLASDAATRPPEETLRAAQLEAVLAHLDAAIDRMGQSRRQLRQRRAERAYRRAAEALAELKHARDPLRDPVEQIGVLLGEVGRVAGATLALVPTPDGSDGAENEDDRASRPAFLTHESVSAEAASVGARVAELAARLGAALEQMEHAGPDGAPGAAASGESGGQAGSAEAREVLRESLSAATPLVASAAEALVRATSALDRERAPEALAEESMAAEALARAQEPFFDLRRLIEATWRAEQQVAVRAGEASADAAEGAEARSRDVAALQATNLERSTRLAALLEREQAARLAELAEAAESAGAPVEGDAEADPSEVERRRFARAAELLGEAGEAMREVEHRSAGAEGGAGPSATDWHGIEAAATRASERLEALRALFFSIAEHVRALALDQVDLADRTREAAALAPTDPPTASDAARGDATRARAEALAREQGDLGNRAGALADALFAQAERQAAAAAGEGGPTAAAPADGKGSEDATEAQRLRRVAEHLAKAQLAMGSATKGLDDDAQPLDPALPEQAAALEELEQALALLAPPPDASPPPSESPDQDESKQDAADDSQQNEKGEQGDSGESEPSPADPSGTRQEESSPRPAPAAEVGDEDAGMGDASQLLQGVRDREAARRRERERRAEQRRPAPVEKDW